MSSSGHSGSPAGDEDMNTNAGTQQTTNEVSSTTPHVGATATATAATATANTAATATTAAAATTAGNTTTAANTSTAAKKNKIPVFTSDDDAGKYTRDYHNVAVEDRYAEAPSADSVMEGLLDSRDMEVDFYRQERLEYQHEINRLQEVITGQDSRIMDLEAEVENLKKNQAAKDKDADASGGGSGGPEGSA